jgi:putative ABC transport system permease protein
MSMLNKFNFLLLLLRTNYKEYLSIFIMSTLMITALASVLFISSSIQKELKSTLTQQADFTIQRFVAGKVLNTPQSWADEFLNIQGVKSVQERVYGTHYYESKEHHFMIVGIDFFDEQTVSAMQSIINTLDVEAFTSKQNMLIGQGVKEFLDKRHYFDYYIFRPPNRGIEKVYIYGVLPQETNILSNDMVLVDKELAKKILGIKEGYATDIVLNVTNPNELNTVYEKLITSHFDARVIQKQELQRHYENLFNYKGGIFIVLYTIVLLLFLLIIYQRFSLFKSKERKEIAILRTLGWSINEIIWLQLIQNAIIALSAYMLGVILAFTYVFFLKAPLLKEIFLGYSNLSNAATSFTPSVEAATLFLLFIFFMIPFLLSIIIPLWRLSITETSEIIR